MKKRLILLLPLLFLACRALSPDRAPTPGSSLTSATPIPVATSLVEATAFAPISDFTLVRIYPQNGDFQSQLAAEAKKASALEQTPFLEFDATWCPPCQAITASLAAKNPLMRSAYHGIYLIHIDIDEWNWHKPVDGLTVDAIPAFFALGPDGKPSGATITGAAWKEDIPENIAPVLTKFFHP